MRILFIYLFSLNSWTCLALHEFYATFPFHANCLIGVVCFAFYTLLSLVAIAGLIRWSPWQHQPENWHKAYVSWFHFWIQVKQIRIYFICLLLYSLENHIGFELERLPLTYATYSTCLDFITCNGNLSTEIAVTHMAGSNDEGRILYDKNFFVEIKTFNRNFSIKLELPLCN